MMPNDYLFEQVRDTLRTVADAVTDAWGNGQSFTCAEADAWIALHRAVGLSDMADDLVDATPRPTVTNRMNTTPATWR